MTSNNLPLPPLKTWAEEHLASVIKASNLSEFDLAFQEFVSKDATITVNGNHVSREEYKKMLQAEEFDEAGATLHINGAVQVPEKTSTQGGFVGLFYRATIREGIRVRDAPVENHITSSMNLVYVQLVSNDNHH
ncbi:hypothetical protein B0H19DRAFT_1338296 [Mycena capillaripes]|nr:hypothetical protein B0H19DRAFT_1338296 [Mycena capillaripes]